MKNESKHRDKNEQNLAIKVQLLKEAIKNGIDSGVALDFDAEKHLAQLKSLKKSETNKLSLNMKKQLSPKDTEALLDILKTRFDKNKTRHKAIDWAMVQERLEAHPAKLWSLNEMEQTDGEPDVVGQDKKTGEYIFYDCSPESPKGRRSICYDHEALETRKENKPANSAINMADEMGIDILTEEEYRQLQELGTFDLKTSSWIQTTAPIRKLGGALFCDRRYNAVFLYHNGAESYYAARGFRGALRV